MNKLKKTENAIELIASTTKKTEATVLNGCVISIDNETLGRMLGSASARMTGNVLAGNSENEILAIQALLTPLHMTFAFIETAKMLDTKNVAYVLGRDGMIEDYTDVEQSSSIEIQEGVKCVHTWARFNDEHSSDNAYKVYIQLTADQVDTFYRIFSKVKKNLGEGCIDFVEELLPVLTSYYLPKFD